MSRVLIVGPTGAGKSTLAAQLSDVVSIPCTDLDDVVLGPGWTRLPDDTARARITALATGDAWIVDGNYAIGRDVLWSRAELVVWLDLSRGLIVFRLLRRTLARLVRRDRMAHGNRESWRRLFSKESILVWGYRSHAPLRAEYERAIAVYGERTTVERLRSTRQVQWWLAGVRPVAVGPDGPPTMEVPSAIVAEPWRRRCLIARTWRREGV